MDDPAEFSEDKSGAKWAPLANKMKPGQNLDYGFNSIELNTILARAWPQIRDEKADPKTVLPASRRRPTTTSRPTRSGRS